MLTEVHGFDDARPIDEGDPAMDIIDAGSEAIERWYLETAESIENFVTADYPLVAAALRTIRREGLATGEVFCELGCGFGVVAAVAAGEGWESMGVEIEPTLVEQARQLCEGLGLPVDLLRGSFVPRHDERLESLSSEVANVSTDPDDVWAEASRGPDQVDLYFAFPWPGEEHFFEAFVDSNAAVGSLLMTYRGREGIRVQRKTD